MTNSNRPRLFFVLGPESSGTRLVTQCLINSGCRGDYGHEQRMDSTKDRGRLFHDCVSPLVLRRSVPHNHDWLTDFTRCVAESEEYGYNVRILVTHRDLTCTARSQVRVGHVDSVEDAERNIRKAYCRIWLELGLYDFPVYIVTYESLVTWPRTTQIELRRWCGLELDGEFVEVRDENSKHFMERARERMAISSGLVGNP